MDKNSRKSMVFVKKTIKKTLLVDIMTLGSIVMHAKKRTISNNTKNTPELPKIDAVGVIVFQAIQSKYILL